MSFLPKPNISIEAIRKNPWNAIRDNLAYSSDRLTLEFALKAAGYCRDSEAFLSQATRAGRYCQPGWTPSENDEDPSIVFDVACGIAHDVYRDIAELIALRFGPRTN